MKERSPSSAFWWLAVVCAFVAVGFHFYLTRHHLDLQYGTSDGTSICNINQTLDCDTVNTSSFSELWGIPLALWGAVVNGAMLLLLLWAKATGFRNDHLNRLCFLFAATIAGASVIMGLISFTQLGTFCLFCMGTYVLSFGLLLGSARMAPLNAAEVPSTFKYLFVRGEEGGFSYLIFFAVIPLLVFLLDGMFRAKFGGDFKVMVEDSMYAWTSNAKNEFDPALGINMKPSEGQYRMHIVEFADFGCSHCRSAAPTLHAFAKSRKDVQFTFMNFPLDGNCNPAISGPGQTCQLAKSFYCANNQGKGWEAHDWIFENQGQIASVDKLPELLQIDGSAFKQCLDSSATHDFIVKQATAGKNAGVKGTPSIFVNGKQLPRGQFMPVLSQVHRSLE